MSEYFKFLPLERKWRSTFRTVTDGPVLTRKSLEVVTNSVAQPPSVAGRVTALLRKDMVLGTRGIESPSLTSSGKRNKLFINISLNSLILIVDF